MNPHTFNPTHVTKYDRELAREFGGIFALDVADKASQQPRTADGRFASNDILMAHLGLDDDCLDCGELDGFLLVEEAYDEPADDRADALFEEMNGRGILDITHAMIAESISDPELAYELHEELDLAIAARDAELFAATERLLKAAKKARRQQADARARATGGLTRSQRRRRNKAARKAAATRH